jgi:hypothetical protein
MRSRAALARVALLGLVLALPVALSASPKKRKRAAAKEPPANFDKSLPVFATKLSALPPGEMKGLADAACLTCHSADMLVQQRLTEKQWAATVGKMVGWGAAVPEDRRSELVAYFVKNFGPDNPGWQPLATRPMGR